ncbi:MAG: glycosyltransferase family 52 [Porphyromonas sp.]|nr:glycosyltransferase family 52 [Porphyromonas sp.]
MNLIFCTSPLQVLIAERILHEFEGEEFYCVYDGDPEAEKPQYYYQRLLSQCKGGRFIQRADYNRSRDVYLNTLALLWMALLLPKIRRMFVASPDNPNIRLLMSGMRSAEVYTYDDGAINLSPQAFSMISHEEGKFVSLLRSFVFIPTVAELRAMSRRHYTIFTQPNVMPNTKLIPLFESSQLAAEEGLGIRRQSILLGQRAYTYDETARDIALAEEVVRRYGITHYLPHPKEDYRIEGVEYIRTPLIAEDYLLGLLREQPDLQVELYSYCSTALLNLSSVPRIKVHAIKPEGSMPLLDETFDLYRSLGIPMDNISLR